MKDPLGLWMTDNAELFRYAGEIPCMREGASSVLLSGSASAFLAPLYRTLYPEAVITAVSDNKAHLAAAKEEEPGLIAIEEDPAGYAGNGFDIAVAYPISFQSIRFAFVRRESLYLISFDYEV